MTFSTKIELVELVSQRLSFEDICEIADSGTCCAIRAIISPEACLRLLEERNSINRPLKKHTKDFLKAQMAAGEFAFNGEPIIFGRKGNLLNGQHRLTAASEEEESLDTLVVFGIEELLFSTIDTGSVRSNADALTIAGSPNAKNTAAALKQVDNYYLDGAIGCNASSRASGKMSNTDILRLSEQHPKMESSVRRADLFARKCKGLTSPSVLAALHYLFSSVDPNLTEEFISIVEDGCLPNRKYDETLAAVAMKLKRVLENSTRGPRRANSSTLAACWIKAWNAYQSQDVPQMFHFRSNESFPKIAGL